MEYRICEANSAARLQKKVNRMIEDGWLPAGGVSASPSRPWAPWWYYQAMIKPRYEPETRAAGAKPLASGFGDFD